jgi:hypothetical protein
VKPETKRSDEEIRERSRDGLNDASAHEQGIDFQRSESPSRKLREFGGTSRASREGLITI